MFIALEQQLINKGFIHMKNKKKLLSLYRKNDPMKQVNIEFLDGSYVFSFPLESGATYSSRIKNKIELEKYSNYIVNSYIKK